MALDSESSDILIHGMNHRNRAVHGDIVVVTLLPRLQWRGRSNAISVEANTERENSGGCYMELLMYMWHLIMTRE